jgi:SpoVK/Ycf46/Vps4 family AAA+-type ATPase
MSTDHPQPPANPEFPAQRITTESEWDDLVLDPQSHAEVESILAWVRQEGTPVNGWPLAGPGFRALFHGPPGTGKTLTTALLGKATGRPVYRVGLAGVVSGEAGESEKDLESLFEEARNQGWILFFDQAEALFGRRTESRNANDRAANQQVSYLLQRIEDFPGLIILATHLRSQMDEAFARRLQAILYFRGPDG